MKALKVILIAVYPILIGLLILTNLKLCSHDNSGRTESDSTRVDDRGRRDSVPSIPSTPADTAAIVKQAEEIGKSGDLKITLLWDFEGDMDLHVKQPNGKEIWYQNDNDPSTGGYLDVDNTTGGHKSAENIYWEKPPKGTYSISLEYFQPSEKNGKEGSGVCTVVIFQEGKEPMIYTTQMNSVGDTSEALKITI